MCVYPTTVPPVCLEISLLGVFGSLCVIDLYLFLWHCQSAVNGSLAYFRYFSSESIFETNVPVGFVLTGSKIVPFWSWLQMGLDLVFIRLRYITGAWKLQSPHKTD